jgi:hypothetical protein
MAGHFSMHGTLTLRVEGAILILEGSGPWNTESLQLKDPAVMDKVHSLYGSPWGVLGIFSGEAIYVPEAVAQLQKRIIHERTLGRKATALVLSGTNSPLVSQMHLKKIYTDAGDTVAAFSAIEDAKLWLRDQIKQANKT